MATYEEEMKNCQQLLELKAKNALVRKENYSTPYLY